MHYKPDDSNINKVCIGDNKIIEMDAGNGWTITDVWFDHNLPIEAIDCVTVKICKCDTFCGIPMAEAVSVIQKYKAELKESER